MWPSDVANRESPRPHPAQHPVSTPDPVDHLGVGTLPAGALQRLGQCLPVFWIRRIQQGRALVAIGDPQDLSVGGAEVEQLPAVRRRGPECLVHRLGHLPEQLLALHELPLHGRALPDILPDSRQVEGQEYGEQQPGDQHHPGAFLEGLGAAEQIGAPADDRQLPVGHLNTLRDLGLVPVVPPVLVIVRPDVPGGETAGIKMQEALFGGRRFVQDQDLHAPRLQQ